jgi:lysophospholipase L1-like esterase
MATAKSIVLLIGINDLFKRDVPETLSNYRKLLEQIPVCKPVVVVLLLPIDSENLHAQLTNTKVNLFNKQLLTLISERPNTLALDVSKDLLNAKGNLDRRFHVGDGLHLNHNGYNVLIAALNAHLDVDLAPFECEYQKGG